MINNNFFKTYFKPLFISIVSFLMLLSAIFEFTVTPVRSREINGCDACTGSSNTQIESVSIEEKDGITTEKFSDGSVLTEEKNGTIELIIPLTSSFFSDEQREQLSQTDGIIQTKSYIALVKILLEVVGGVFTVCEIVEWMSNYTFNPCQVAREYLGNHARSGTYIIEGEYIPGRIPGCEPAHSLPCNSGYYKYRFIPD